MIVYNVKRRWFSLKNEAEAYRRAEGLPAGSTYTLRVDDREGLAFLLNGLCGTPIETDHVPEAKLEVIQRNSVLDNIPDYVPKFLRDEWEKKMKRSDS